MLKHYKEIIDLPDELSALYFKLNEAAEILKQKLRNMEEEQDDDEQIALSMPEDDSKESVITKEEELKTKEEELKTKEEELKTKEEELKKKLQKLEREERELKEKEEQELKEKEEFVKEKISRDEQKIKRKYKEPTLNDALTKYFAPNSRKRKSAISQKFSEATFPEYRKGS